MKAEYLNPFVTATVETFKSMIGAEATPGDLAVARDRKTGRDITAVIGFVGNIKGSLILAVDKEAAAEIISRFIQSDSVTEEELYDGVRELCNIIGGSAKSELNKLGLNLSVALPNVFVGREIEVATSRHNVTLHVPFLCSVGDFDMRVSFAQ